MGATGLPTDIRVVEAEAQFSAAYPRGSFMFGNAVAGELTLCHVRARVQNRRGTVADGWGAIFLSHYWAYPTEAVAPAAKDAAMRRIVAQLCERAAGQAGYGHPLDLFPTLQAELPALARSVGGALAVPPTDLAALVCAAPLDAAIHDAFGRVNGIATYDGYGPEHCGHDLAHHLGPAFAGRYVADYLRPQPVGSVPIAHTVGGLDRLRPGSDAPATGADGLPETLVGWIARDGVHCFKIKLRGNDMAWDLDRLIEVHAVAREGRAPGATDPIQLSVDFNGQCESQDYAVALLRQLRERAPATDAALRYVEQPTGLDTLARGDDMRALAALRPVVVDESMTSLAAVDRALAHGWTGLALKTCKCHSLDLLLVARAEERGLLYMIQDLSNPGIALLHSLGLAARLRPRLGVEANARQYYPAESAPEAERYPATFIVHGGSADIEQATGPGLGYDTSAIARPLFRASPAHAARRS